ncbi:unnamed protein product [Arabis nemorensis]|uniref:Serine-tRNA synthetase type1 N-terminal domain-containing protein n=1 Tax=Arabis nemorensis TaxID=586526 RepID=A0A565B3V5_9BRAS|nr:unnamed protein product [Arabis nemorensis]
MVDIDLFRENPEIIRASQRRRFASVDLVDEIIKLDKEWRQGKYESDGIRKDFNKLNKEVAKLKTIIKQRSTEKEATVGEVFAALEAKLELVPFPLLSFFQVWGDQTRAALLNHVDLVDRLHYLDTEGGVKVAGARAFFLGGDGALLKRGLTNFALNLLRKKGYREEHPPLFMNKAVMAKCAQLSQFDEELYKVTGEGDDKYLIATSEQPLCARHQDKCIHPTKLPIRYIHGRSDVFAFQRCATSRERRLSP